MYVIGSPLFTKATLHLPNGKTFKIVAKNNSADNIYIQSAVVNGKKFDQTWIAHDTIANGGEIVFEMGPSPNKNWGSKPDAAPFSVSKK